MTLTVTCHDYTAWASVVDDLCDIPECALVGWLSPIVKVQTEDDSIRRQMEVDDRVKSVEVVQRN